MAEGEGGSGVEALFDLVLAQAAAVEKLPRPDREEALAAIRARHERSGLKAGMSREAALAMADQLDAWIRAALSLTERPPSQTLH